MWPFIESINSHTSIGSLYKALKEVKKLIAYEGKLLENPPSGVGLRERCQGDRQPA
jgi:flagellar protein FlbT